jgi:hypothetical protein
MADKRKQDDEQYRNEREAELGELFADALTRIEAGETTDVILATCPNEHRAQLRSMLLLGEALFAQQHAPMPTRSTARRTAQRQAFLQQIPQVRAEQMPAPAAASAAAIDSAMPAPTPKGTMPPNRFNLGQWLADGWSRIQEATTARGYSLAPLLATLLIALIASLATVQVTQAAVPGDLTYRVKDWARSAELVLTPPDLRQPVVERREREFEQEVAIVAQRNEQRTNADLNRLVVQETLTLPFRGFNGRTLAFGDLTVFPSYQPNANDLVTRNPMTFDGELVEGALVELTVLILPGRTDFVQGVYAKVIAPPPTLTPAPEAAPSALPVSTRPALPPCTPLRPAGWATYTVLSGDTISRLAGLAEVDIRQVSGVNCLESEFISSGQTIYLPPLGVPTVIPPAETATPTLLPTETPMETPAQTPAETPTVAPTASETLQAPTVEPSATSEQTLEPTAQPTETGLPNPNATPVPTQEPTTGPGSTSTPTETAEPGATPTATQEPTATVPTATPQPGVTSEASATPEGGATVEATASPVIEMTPTEAQTEATATATSQEPTLAPPTATSLPDTPTATIAATLQPTVESAIATAASTPTAKATAPQPVAPTVVPPPAPTNAPPPAVATVQPPSAPTEDAGGASTGAADDGQDGDQSSSQP